MNLSDDEDQPKDLLDRARHLEDTLKPRLRKLYRLARAVPEKLPAVDAAATRLHDLQLMTLVHDEISRTHLNEIDEVEAQVDELENSLNGTLLNNHKNKKWLRRERVVLGLFDRFRDDFGSGELTKHYSRVADEFNTDQKLMADYNKGKAISAQTVGNIVRKSRKQGGNIP